MVKLIWNYDKADDNAKDKYLALKYLTSAAKLANEFDNSEKFYNLFKEFLKNTLSQKDFEEVKNILAEPFDQSNNHVNKKIAVLIRQSKIVPDSAEKKAETISEDSIVFKLLFKGGVKNLKFMDTSPENDFRNHHYIELENIAGIAENLARSTSECLDRWVKSRLESYNPVADITFHRFNVKDKNEWLAFGKQIGAAAIGVFTVPAIMALVSGVARIFSLPFSNIMFIASRNEIVRKVFLSISPKTADLLSWTLKYGVGMTIGYIKGGYWVKSHKVEKFQDWTNSEYRIVRFIGNIFNALTRSEGIINVGVDTESFKGKVVANINGYLEKLEIVQQGIVNAEDIKVCTNDYNDVAEIKAKADEVCKDYRHNVSFRDAVFPHLGIQRNVVLR